MEILATEHKSYNYQEDNDYPVADNSIYFQTHIVNCQEEAINLVFQKGHNINVDRRLSEEHKRKISEAQKGRPSKCKGKKYPNRSEMLKGSKNPFFAKHHSEETKIKISESSRGRIPWNKDKKGCFSEETIRKMTISQKGLQSGEKHPFFGRHHIKESRKKIYLAHIGKELSLEHKQKISESLKGSKNPRWGKHHSEQTRKKLSEAIKSLTGERAPNWKGGISFLPYCSKFNKALKEKIRERDGRKCQLCPCNEEENRRKLDVHHVHYDKENCAPDLILLCRRCNSKVNGNRDYYENLFISKLVTRGVLLCQ